MKIALVVAAGVLTTTPLASPAKAQGVKWPKSICRPAGTSKTATTATIGTGGVMTPTPQLASIQAVSPSAHDRAVAWKLPRSNGTTAAGSRAGSASATNATSAKDYSA